MTAILKFFASIFRFIGWLIKFIIRSLGVLFIMAAFVAAIVDGIRSIIDNELILTALGKWWTDIHPVSLNQTQFFIQEHLGFIWLWDNVLQWTLLQPAVAVLAVLGIVIYMLGRKSKKSTDYIA